MIEKPIKPLFVYEVKQKHYEEEGLFLACRIPFVPNHKKPYQRLSRTFPELISEDGIFTTGEYNIFRYQIQLKTKNSLFSAKIGEWIIISIDESKQCLALHGNVSHKVFLERYIPIDEEGFYKDIGIIKNHEMFKLAVRLPLTTWAFYEDNDIEILIDLIRKNGGTIDYHNGKENRQLRIPLYYMIKDKDSPVKITHPLGIAHAGEWVIMDYMRNMTVMSDMKFEDMLNLNKENAII